MNSPQTAGAVRKDAGLVSVRDATPQDMEAIRQIYAGYVLGGVATFEEVPPTAAEIEARWKAITGQGLPYLVAERAGRVLGYSYASSYRPRVAYRYTVEDSIYIAPEAARQGIGRLLLQALIQRCEQGPWRQMIAVIGDSANHGSIALHRSLGFSMTGIQPATGYKLGRWVDTVLMQRALGAGGATAPEPRAGNQAA